jgi:hypothetical protein
MRLSVIGVFVGLVLTGVSPALATTYDLVSQGYGIGLNGTIVTDGTMGTLAQANILDWQITETSTASPGYLTAIDATNSTLSLLGSALSATSSGLVFNFNSTISSLLSFTSTQTNYIFVLRKNEPAFQLIYCDTGGACKSPFNTAFKVQLILTSPAGGTYQAKIGGTSQIATLEPVPLPEGLSLLLTGLAGFAGLGLQQRAHRAAPAFHPVGRSSAGSPPRGSVMQS